MTIAEDGEILIDKERAAVVVVDAQNAFASDIGSLASNEVDVSGPIETVPQLQKFIELIRSVGLPIVFTRSVRRADKRDAPSNNLDIVPEIYRERDPICLSGTPDVEYVMGIEPNDNEYEVTKLRYDAFSGTELQARLQAEGVNTVLICGFMTNGCVEATGRTAYEKGYNVVLVEDCSASVTQEGHESAVNNFQTLLGAVSTSEEIRFV